MKNTQKHMLASTAVLVRTSMGNYSHMGRLSTSAPVKPSYIDVHHLSATSANEYAHTLARGIHVHTPTCDPRTRLQACARAHQSTTAIYVYDLTRTMLVHAHATRQHMPRLLHCTLVCGIISHRHVCIHLGPHTCTLDHRRPSGQWPACSLAHNIRAQINQRKGLCKWAARY